MRPWIFDTLSVIVVLVAIAAGAIITQYDWHTYMSGALQLATFSIQIMMYLRTRNDELSDEHIEKRSWKLIVGLVEGDDEKGFKRTREDVLVAYKQWILRRKSMDAPIVTGDVAAESDVVYPYDDTAVHQAVVCCQGELSVAYDAKRTDFEVARTVRDLCIHLGTELKQRRVYFSYLEKQYLVFMDENNKWGFKEVKKE